MQTLALEASAKDVKLWWPAGMGKQELYRMNVTFKPKAGAAVSTSRRVGFRYFALATGNDTDTSLVEKEKNEQGSESHGIYFHCYPINMVGLYLKHMEQAGGIEHSTPW